MRLTDGGLLRGEFHYGVADGHWSLMGTKGERYEWQLKDGIPKELQPLLRGL
jgi:hypothetical protein